MSDSIFKALQAGTPLSEISHRVLSGSSYSPALQHSAALAPPASADTGAVLPPPPPPTEPQITGDNYGGFFKALQRPQR